MNIDLFGNKIKNKSYRALRHDITRSKQKANSIETHHPDYKINQINSYLVGNKSLPEKDKVKILELFAGRGNLTKIYDNIGKVEAYDKTHLKTGDSYKVFHKLIYKRKKYNIIDLDPYGFPNRFFPDIFLLIDKGFLIITMPKPYVNILNGITKTHLSSYYGVYNPSKMQVIERICTWGLCHWRKVTLLNTVKFDKMWRFLFEVEKVKATDYTGVKNK